MHAKILKTFLPSLVGIISVLLLLFLYNLLTEQHVLMNSSDTKFFVYFVPIVTLCAFVIQYSITLPAWKYFKSHGKIIGLNIFMFISLVSVIAGVIFGMVFWEKNYGLSELLSLSVIGVLAFIVYWAINLIILKTLDRK
jgi:hypothetical protein